MECGVRESYITLASHQESGVTFSIILVACNLFVVIDTIHVLTPPGQSDYTYQNDMICFTVSPALDGDGPWTMGNVFY